MSPIVARSSIKPPSETFTEKLLSPLLITMISFFGFMFYIYCFVQGVNELYLTVTPSFISFLALLLILRPRLRVMRDIPDSVDSDSEEARLERRQKRKDDDARYFGMIIFILSVIYIVFVELIPLIEARPY